MRVRVSFLHWGHFFIFAVLCLLCSAWAFSSCSEQGLLFVMVPGLLTVVASLVAKHRLYRGVGFSNYNSWA